MIFLKKFKKHEVIEHQRYVKREKKMKELKKIIFPFFFSGEKNGKFLRDP